MNEQCRYSCIFCAGRSGHKSLTAMLDEMAAALLLNGGDVVNHRLPALLKAVPPATAGFNAAAAGIGGAPAGGRAGGGAGGGGATPRHFDACKRCLVAGRLDALLRPLLVASGLMDLLFKVRANAA